MLTFRFESQEDNSEFDSVRVEKPGAQVIIPRDIFHDLLFQQAVANDDVLLLLSSVVHEALDVRLSR